MSDYAQCQYSDNLTVYECKCRYLVSIVLLVHGCEQDKIYTTVWHRTLNVSLFPKWFILKINGGYHEVHLPLFRAADVWNCLGVMWSRNKYRVFRNVLRDYKHL
jgi:hypothetical protein